MNTSPCFCTYISIFIYSIHERLSNACDPGGICARLVDSVAYMSCVVISDNELQWCCSGITVVLQGDTGGICARLVDSVAYVSCVVIGDNELQWCCSGVAVRH